MKSMVKNKSYSYKYYSPDKETLNGHGLRLTILYKHIFILFQDNSKDLKDKYILNSYMYIYTQIYLDERIKRQFE